MAKLMIFLCFFVKLLLNSRADHAVRNVAVADLHWDGVSAFIVVDRQAVQDRLDAYHNTRFEKLENEAPPQLYVPEQSVFPDFWGNDQHVVYVDFGSSASNDFVEESSVSSSGVESGVIIPFLSDSLDGPPKYSVAMAEFYPRDRGEPAKPNIIYPFISIDKMTVDENGAFWRDGTEELQVSFVKSNPCRPPSQKTTQVFQKFFTDLSLLGWSEPDIEMCDRHPLKNEYCSVMNTIKNDVEEALPNVCQTYDIADLVVCAASFEVINVTPGFRDFLLLNDNPIDVIAAERFYCNATTAFKFPCVI